MEQSIQNPHGISMFGSCVVYVEPDFCTVDFVVSRTAAKPNEASNAAKQAASAVSGFLQKSGIESRDFRQSRVEIGIGEGTYDAEIRFNLSVSDLSKVEPLLVGIINSGANQIRKLRYRSSRLRDARVEARQGAFLAALKKAEVFAEAAGIQVGRTLHIEELDAADLQELEDMDDFQTSGSVNPNTLIVGSAVRVSFMIKGGKTAAATGQFVAFDP